MLRFGEEKVHGFNLSKCLCKIFATQVLGAHIANLQQIVMHFEVLMRHGSKVEKLARFFICENRITD